MENTTNLVIPGTRASGVDVSVDRRGWLQMHAYAVAFLPTVEKTGVSARGCRT